MIDLLWIRVLAWALAAFFFLGFFINTFAVKRVGPDYKRWGYPDGFRFVTGVLELAVALLMLTAATRPYGLLLGCGIMVAAVATVAYHREYQRGVPALVVLVLMFIVAGAMWFNVASPS
ncbi:DoxX family protein [Paraburkholderia humisilvae]|uniref:DoxX family protein n=1 Tax=Paraburkholderia humisilvae TaxID=627669 RepID=A0A6J5F652_9BURK|nr:DoxX family protein [Paraburkholderia humisilvae]CAB3774340.1 hypothetical protein LMG29542_07733 [Paraburkholderia humisilvae]